MAMLFDSKGLAMHSPVTSPDPQLLELTRTLHALTACVIAGDLSDARIHATLVWRANPHWIGTYAEGAVHEALAHLAAADEVLGQSDPFTHVDAEHHLDLAIAAYEEGGRASDAARVRSLRDRLATASGAA